MIFRVEKDAAPEKQSQSFGFIWSWRQYWGIAIAAANECDIKALFVKKKGHFVVDDSIGISLLTALNYYENNGRYLLIKSSVLIFMLDVFTQG